MQFFFFSESWILQGAIAHRQRSAVATLDASVGLKKIQILSNSDLGRAELFRQVHDQNPAVAIQDFQNMSAPFFVQHSFVGASALSMRILHLTGHISRK